MQSFRCLIKDFVLSRYIFENTTATKSIRKFFKTSLPTFRCLYKELIVLWCSADRCSLALKIRRKPFRQDVMLCWDEIGAVRKTMQYRTFVINFLK